MMEDRVLSSTHEQMDWKHENLKVLERLVRRDDGGRIKECTAGLIERVSRVSRECVRAAVACGGHLTLSTQQTLHRSSS